jgi:hypothetical protein
MSVIANDMDDSELSAGPFTNFTSIRDGEFFRLYRLENNDRRSQPD